MDINKFARDVGQRIAKEVSSEYGEDVCLSAEEEIYKKALHEANTFFIKRNNAKSDNKILEFLRYRLQIRVEKQKEIEKLSPEEMLANVIKIEALDSLGVL